MGEWWMTLGNAGQVFACIAIPATMMLLVQMILTFVGLGGDTGADADTGAEGDTADSVEEVNDFSGGELHLFTFRGVIAFFSVMGWVGIICCGLDVALPLTIILSALAGASAMLLIAVIMKWLMGLQYDGTEDIRDAVGVSGTVYLRVPPARTGAGKINAVIQGKLCEKNAVTDEETTIERGEEVTVIGISGGETLIVRRKNKI